MPVFKITHFNNLSQNVIERNALELATQMRTDVTVSSVQ